MFVRYDGTALAFQVGTQHLGATARPLQLLTDNAARMTINTTGNVGIGTTAPAGSLHIRNDQAAFTGIYVDNRSGGSGSYSGISLGSNSSGGQQWFLTRENQTTARLDIALNLGSPFMSILAGGNVGIGTTAPSSKLHVEGGTSPTVLIRNTATTGYSQLTFGNTVVTGTGLWLNGSIQTGYGGANSLNVYSSDGPIAFHTASVTNALSIAQNGTSTHAGNLIFAPDNTYDIGASGANRPRNIYVAGAVIAGGLQVISGGGIQNSIGTGANIYFISGASRLAFDLGGGVFWNDSSNNPLAAATVGVMRNATGILEVNSGTLGAFRDVRCRSVIQQPPASTTPASNGDYVVEATSNTTLTFKLKGTDGIVRTATLTLAP
jgi:hypothetical protein